MVVAQRTHAPGVVEEWLLPHSARNRRASKPLPSQITQDVCSHTDRFNSLIIPPRSALKYSVKQTIRWTTSGQGERTRNTIPVERQWRMARSGLGGGSFLRPSRCEFSHLARRGASFFSTCLPAMTASTAVPPASTAAPSHLSKTNTDTLCCDSSEGFIRRFVYRINLWSGAYMLERHERICLYSAVGLFFVSSCLYTVLFASGFVDGWKEFPAEI